MIQPGVHANPDLRERVVEQIVLAEHFREKKPVAQSTAEARAKFEQVEAIAKAAKTGSIGDGKVFVFDIDQALRIRTGETNDDAI